MDHGHRDVDLKVNTTQHPGLTENIAPDGGPGSDDIVKGIPPWDNSWGQDGLRCGKGVTNQQWSIVGVVNDFLDPIRWNILC